MTEKTTLSDANYRQQPATPCCHNCLHARPGDGAWLTIRCSITVNRANVDHTAICDRYEPADTSR